jgi:hypothetical protein
MKRRYECPLAAAYIQQHDARATSTVHASTLRRCEARTRLKDAGQRLGDFFSFVQEKEPPDSGGFAVSSGQWKRLVKGEWPERESNPRHADFQGVGDPSPGLS